MIKNTKHLYTYRSGHMYIHLYASVHLYTYVFVHVYVNMYVHMYVYVLASGPTTNDELPPYLYGCHAVG